MEQTGKLGYVEGLSSIFVKALKDMDVTERPIRCTDIKRETVYVKDQDKWEIEDKDKSRLKNTIKALEEKNMSSLIDWQMENPRFQIMDTKENSDYIQISLNSLEALLKRKHQNNKIKLSKMS